METYLDLLKSFEKDPSLCNFFKLQAHETWKRIGFARNKSGLRIYETTITQNILFHFMVNNLHRGLDITMEEAENERANGDDILMKIQSKKISLDLPMQAKIIYSNNKYPRMRHGSQIESLISYAEKRDNAYPLYILYNYVPQLVNDINYQQLDSCGHPYDYHQYGITLVSAYHLRDQYYNRLGLDKSGVNHRWDQIPWFFDLHPSDAIPWFKMVCCKGKELDEFLQFLRKHHPNGQISGKKNEPDRQPPDQSTDEEGWKTISLEGLEDRITSEKDPATAEEQFRQQKKGEFVPKYKVTLNLK